MAKSWILPCEWCYEGAGVGGMSMVTIQAPKFLSGSMAKLWLPNGLSDGPNVTAWGYNQGHLRGLLTGWLCAWVPPWFLCLDYCPLSPPGKASMGSALVISRDVYTIIAFGVIPPGFLCLPEPLLGHGSFRKIFHNTLLPQDHLGRLGYPGLTEESSCVWDIVNGSPSGPCSPNSPQ